MTTAIFDYCARCHLQHFSISLGICCLDKHDIAALAPVGMGAPSNRGDPRFLARWLESCGGQDLLLAAHGDVIIGLHQITRERKAERAPAVANTGLLQVL